MASIQYTYAGTFEGNILVVGQTGCGKTTFIQILAKNHMFGDLKEIFQISKISLSSEKEENIKGSYRKEANFKCPENFDDFSMLLNYFQRKREDSDCNDNILMGEDNIFNKLIVMDNVLGLADKSDSFANF